MKKTKLTNVTWTLSESNNPPGNLARQLLWADKGLITVKRPFTPVQ